MKVKVQEGSKETFIHTKSEKPTVWSQFTVTKQSSNPLSIPHFNQFVNICFHFFWGPVSKNTCNTSKVIQCWKHKRGKKYMKGINTFYRQCNQSLLSTATEVWAGGQLISHMLIHTYCINTFLSQTFCRASSCLTCRGTAASVLCCPNK